MPERRIRSIQNAKYVYVTVAINYYKDCLVILLQMIRTTWRRMVESLWMMDLTRNDVFYWRQATIAAIDKKDWAKRHKTWVRTLDLWAETSTKPVVKTAQWPGVLNVTSVCETFIQQHLGREKIQNHATVAEHWPGSVPSRTTSQHEKGIFLFIILQGGLYNHATFSLSPLSPLTARPTKEKKTIDDVRMENEICERWKKLRRRRWGALFSAEI